MGEIETLQQESIAMGMHSPESELLKFLIYKMKTHKESVEAELTHEQPLELLSLPGIDEVMLEMEGGGRAVRLQENIHAWRLRNLYIG